MADLAYDNATSPSTSDQPLDGGDQPLTRNSSFSKLNAKAPEFVPKKQPMIAPAPPPPPAMLHVFHPVPPNSPFPVPIPLVHHHPHPHHQHQNHQQKQEEREKDHGHGHGHGHGNGGSRKSLSDDATQKLINQVEFYFSDVNLATTDHLIRFINKDPEGYVPISVVASFKKVKAHVNSNSQLAAVLRNSTKLVVSEDGKKVKRLHSLTGSDMEELQARIIVAENLPEDHCHQNLMKIFSAIGSVKSIRTCLPQPSNNGASSANRPSKNDNVLFGNKLHAFVEYESLELAEKAVTELNDEDDWRNGLRIRLLHKRGSKSSQAQAKKTGGEGDGTCDEEATSTSEQNQNQKQSEDSSEQIDIQSHEQGEEQNMERENGQRKGRNRGRGKGRGRGQHHHQQNRGNHVGATPANNAVNGEHPAVPKQQPPGPRMPDGTRGFSMGRGRPITVNTAA